MPTYVYGCSDKSHPIQEIKHGMNENPTIKCQECGQTMHRIPQRFRFGFNPEGVLLEWMDDNYRRKRAGRQLNSPDLVKRPGKPIPLRNPRSK